MAVEFNVKSERSSIYKFNPEDVKIHPELNGRHELPDIEALIQDILERGQLQPVIIRSDGGTPTLVAGFSRWRAISEINKRGLAPARVPILCTYLRGSAMDGFIANVRENKLRNETTALDDAYNIDRLLKWGKTMAEVASIYGEKESWVKDRLQLLQLGDEARTALADGRMKPSAAVSIAKLSEEQQRNAIKNSQGKKITAKKARETVTKKHVWSITELRIMLQEIADEGTVPDWAQPIIEKSTKQQIIPDFCAALLEYIQ